MKNAILAHGGAMPNFDLSTLDDIWAAVAALNGDGQTDGERAALHASLACIERLGARPGWGHAYQPEETKIIETKHDPYGEETMEETRARWKRNLERAGHDSEWLEAK